MKIRITTTIAVTSVIDADPADPAFVREVGDFIDTHHLPSTSILAMLPDIEEAYAVSSTVNKVDDNGMDEGDPITDFDF